jgi:hypothetical protein
MPLSSTRAPEVTTALVKYTKTARPTNEGSRVGPTNEGSRVGPTNEGSRVVLVARVQTHGRHSDETAQSIHETARNKTEQNQTIKL